MTETLESGPRIIIPAQDVGQLEILRDHSEIERIELLATTLDDSFKNDLMMCNANMMKTGKANAFAIYKKPDGIEVSKPVLADPEYVRKLGKDSTQCVWREETKIDDLLRDDSPKKQKLLYEWDKDQDKAVPRKDVWAYIVSFPMGELDHRGLTARDIQRPTRDFLDLYLQQEQLHPGFIGGILTNDGKKSGLILFKKSEDVDKVDSRMWGHLGGGDGIDRKLVLGAMGSAGFVYADIDLTCPKNRDPGKLYEQRVARAVEAIF